MRIGFRASCRTEGALWAQCCGKKYAEVGANSSYYLNRRFSIIALFCLSQF